MIEEELDFEEQPAGEDTSGKGSGSGADGDGRGEGGGEKGDKGGKAGKGKDKPSDEVKLSKKDHDSLMKRIGELEESERYWADQAKAGKPGKGKAGADDDGDEDGGEPEEMDPAKLVDEFGSKGIKALIGQGLLTEKAAKELIRKEAAKITREAIDKERRNMQVDSDLTRKFPDLADAKSELFRRTAEVMKEEFGEDRDMLRNPKALMAAARIADAELKAESGTKGRGEDEEDRLERVRRQQGDRGKRGTGFDDDDESGLTQIQREFAKKMGLSEDTYKKHAGALKSGGGRR